MKYKILDLSVSILHYKYEILSNCYQIEIRIFPYPRWRGGNLSLDGCGSGPRDGMMKSLPFSRTSLMDGHLKYIIIIVSEYFYRIKVSVLYK